MKKQLTLIAALALVAGVLVACGGSSDSDPGNSGDASVEVSDAWARATTPSQDSGAIYLTLRAKNDDALIKAEVPTEVAGITEIHETVEGGAPTDGTGPDMGADHDTSMKSGDSAEMAEGPDAGGHSGSMMKMQQVEQVKLPAGETVKLEPGGFHIMLMELKGQIKPGDSIPVSLTFEKAGKVEVDATARNE